jgi:hypothetical protein
MYYHMYIQYAKFVGIHSTWKVRVSWGSIEAVFRSTCNVTLCVRGTMEEKVHKFSGQSSHAAIGISLTYRESRRCNIARSTLPDRVGCCQRK